MAKAEFFDNYGLKAINGFAQAQEQFAEVFGPGGSIGDKTVTANRKKYVISETFTLDNGFTFDATYTIKGRLNTSKPFSKRKVKSVEVEFAGQKSIYTELNATFEDFINPEINLFKQVFSGNDTLTGNPNEATILTGFRGDDILNIKSQNQAFGGRGADVFALSKDTRSAEIFDYNPNRLCKN